jgi:hypothetical protein
MKNVIFLIALVLLTNSNVFAQTTPESEFTVTLTADNRGVVIVRYNGTAREVIIPSTIQGMPVREIGGQRSDWGWWTGAFQNNSTITSVVIPEGVTIIYNGNFQGYDGAFHGAFAGCTQLTTVTLPSTLTHIGNFAFRGCRSLRTITVPISVTSIGNSAFQGCTSLRNITLPDNLTSIGNNAFADCSVLQTIELPNSLTSIGRGAFQRSGLTSIVWPASVSIIAGQMFNNCRDLHTVEIPVGVTGMDGRTGSESFRGPFSGCSSLTTITFPEGFTSIGAWSFEGTSLISITLPSTIRSIGHAAFSGIRSLTTVNIPETVQQITFGREFTNRPFTNFQGSSNINLLSQAALRRVGYTGDF